MVPDDFKREVPSEFKSLPILQRRATVEMVLQHPDKTPYDVDGKLFDDIRLNLVIDGYNAPVTGGNFVDLVSKGFYNNKPVSFIQYQCIIS